MALRLIHGLLPEEDALDDPDEDDEADPSLPGDLWFRLRRAGIVLYSVRQRAK